MGSSAPSSNKAVQIPTNDKTAETTAETAPAVTAPAPVITLNQSSPDSLAYVQQQAAQDQAKRGRKFLQITPTVPARTSSGSGISIPT